MQAVVDAPIVCILEPGILQQRLDWIRRVTVEGLLSYRLNGTTLQLTYRQELGPELERIVADEQKCCPFLRFTLKQAESAVLLSIEAPGGLGKDARWLFDQFLPRPAPASATRLCGCAPGKCG